MPTYAALIYTPAEAEGQGTPEDWARIMAEYDAFGEEAGAAGVIVGGEALEDTHTATTVRSELEWQLGMLEQAAGSLHRALACELNQSDRDLLEERLAALVG